MAGRVLGEERKVVTILFADVIGSTALGEQLDPERLRALLGTYFSAMAAIIESWGGTVEEYIGDAIMAVFGVPAVHEDDAERAFRFADPLTLDLKGKSEAARAYPLIEALPTPGRGMRGLNAPMIGRERELATLLGLMNETVETGQPRLVVVY